MLHQAHPEELRQLLGRLGIHAHQTRGFVRRQIGRDRERGGVVDDRAEIGRELARLHEKPGRGLWVVEVRTKRIGRVTRVDQYVPPACTQRVADRLADPLRATRD